jgi:hypothetical protein
MMNAFTSDGFSRPPLSSSFADLKAYNDRPGG